MLFIKSLPAAVLVAGVFASVQAQAGMTTDSHGNVGYDTAAECDAAVNAGSAKFYQSFTAKPALRRAGETTVRVTTLSNMGPQYVRGACDLGAGKSFNRDGVSQALQGKYVPYSPSMLVNAYFDKDNQPTRITMKQCDNNFSAAAPRPVAETVVAAPAVVAPVVAAPRVVDAEGFPYLFATAGASRDGFKPNNLVYNGSKTALAGQAGVGYQFNKLVGAELFYQDGKKQEHRNNTATFKAPKQAYGARVTLGGNVTDELRVFGKAGVARVRHLATTGLPLGHHTYKNHLTAGAGLTYKFTEQLNLRADYDHYFKSNSSSADPAWKAIDYLGLGMQYNF